MAKVTWLGEPGGASSTDWRGVHFEKGKPAEVTDADTIARAKGNRFFKVGDSDTGSQKAPAKPPMAPEKAPAKPPAKKEKARKWRK